MDRTLDLNYREYLPADKDAAILDFGCGDGRVMAYLHFNGYTDVSGVDIDKNSIDSHPEGYNSVYSADPIGHVENMQKNFDLIILKDVVYYFERTKVVENCERILKKLKPGGVAIIEVFNGALFTAPYTSYNDIGIQTFYTERSLGQIVKECKLEVVDLFGVKLPNSGILFQIYCLGQWFFRCLTGLVYLLERGAGNNPRIRSRSLIAICRKPL